jgi:hypothetical protein
MTNQVLSDLASSEEVAGETNSSSSDRGAREKGQETGGSRGRACRTVSFRGFDAFTAQDDKNGLTQTKTANIQEIRMTKEADFERQQARRESKLLSEASVRLLVGSTAEVKSTDALRSTFITNVSAAVSSQLDESKTDVEGNLLSGLIRDQHAGLSLTTRKDDAPKLKLEDKPGAGSQADGNGEAEKMTNFEAAAKVETSTRSREVKGGQVKSKQVCDIPDVRPQQEPARVSPHYVTAAGRLTPTARTPGRRVAPETPQQEMVEKKGPAQWVTDLIRIFGVDPAVCCGQN